MTVPNSIAIPGFRAELVARFRGPVEPGGWLPMEMKVIERKASVAKMAGIAAMDGVKPPETNA